MRQKLITKLIKFILYVFNETPIHTRVALSWVM